MRSLAHFYKSYRKKTLDFQLSGRESLKEKGVIPDTNLFNDILAPGTDRRYGVNLIARPSHYVSSYLINTQNYLREFEPGQYYYPIEDFHLTVLEICHSCTLHYAQETATKLLGILEKCLYQIPFVRVGSPILVYDNHSCALSFVPFDQSLNKIRVTIKDRIQERGIQLSPRYVPQSAHITLMRYIVPLQTELERWLEVLSHVPNQNNIEWNIDCIWLTWGNTWYGMQSRIQVAGPYQLQLQN